MHDLVVRNAKVLVEGRWETTDLAIENGQFAAEPTGPSRAEVDASGMLCLPGAVDAHVHFNEPGRTHWEGFATGSLAAAVGGITTLVEMPLNSIPSTVDVASLETKLAAIGSQSHVDFALWGGLVPGNVPQLAALAKAGVASFKAFMSPSGTNDFENSDVATLRAGMKEIQKTGKLLALHAEDPASLSQARPKAKVSATDWESSRPVLAEINAVKIAIDLAGETGCPIHIVHVSAPKVLEVIQAAKSQGLDITCETCPHYLLLSIEDALSIGPNAKCAPPLRPAATVSELWKSLRSGMIDTIGTDHSPSSPELKQGMSFFEAWGGIAGIQHGLPLLWQQALADEALFETLLCLSCRNPARRFEIPAKGSLAPGADADFTLVEVKAERRPIQAADLRTRHPESAYTGLPLQLAVRETWLRGQRVQLAGEACSKPTGRFIRL